MIVDSSAVLAIVLDEADLKVFEEALGSAQSLRMSAANFVEAAIRVDRSANPLAVHAFDLLEISDTRLEPVTVAQALLATRGLSSLRQGHGSSCLTQFRRLLRLRARQGYG